MSDCSVPCKMSWDELEALCRRERLHSKQLGVNKANVNEYEVEFLCDYKKTRVRYQDIIYPPHCTLTDVHCLKLQAAMIPVCPCTAESAPDNNVK